MINEKNDFSPVNPTESTETQDDFTFVQKDKAIHEQHFQTKPSSFLKDSLKRFSRNKASLVGFIIIGILFLMSIIVPFADTNNIDTPNSNIAFLTPRAPGFEKLGFWDGGRQINDVIVEKDGSLRNFDKAGVIGEIHYVEKPISVADPAAHGGRVLIMPQKTGGTGTFFSPLSTYSSSESLSIEFSVLVPDSSASYAPANVSVDFYTAEDNYGQYQTYNILPKNKDYLNQGKVGENYTYTITNEEIQSALSKDSNYVSKGETKLKLGFSAAADASDPKTPRIGLQVANVTIKSSNESSTLTALSWSDGNDVKLRTDDQSWSASGDSSLIGATTTYASFRYDTYFQSLGDRQMQISGYEISNYINQGYISYDFVTKEFKMLKEDSPIRQILSQTEPVPGQYDVIAIVSYYRYLGYKSMPYFLFGTNQDGKDYFKLVFTGLRLSLFLGIGITFICVLVGITWGAIEGYFGGWVDISMERFTDILGGIPTIVLLTLIMLNLGSNPFTFILAMCLTGWIGVASSMRSQVYRYKRREFVLASRTLGAKDGRLLFFHIVPNAIGPIVTSSVLMVPSVILSEASIAYLGIGLKNIVSLGVTISEVQGYLNNAPYLTILSSIIIALLMICFNLFGNGLRDAFNPSLRGSGEEI